MKRLALAVLLVFTIGLLAACGAASVPQLTGKSANPPAPEIGRVPAAAPTAAPAQPQPPAQGAPSGGFSGVGDSGLRQAMDQAVAERMVVYTGKLSLEVNDTEETVSKIADILKQNQGYISSRSLDRDSKGKVQGFITIRVPAASLEPVLQQIRALGLKVIHEDANSEDVTAEYTDLDARRKNLEAYEAELTQLLDTVRERTGKAEDILAVYNQLTDVRGQIEQIKGRQNLLQNTSSYATYTIQFVPHEEVEVVEPGQWNPGNTARTALKSLVQAVQALADVGITVALFILPVLILLALPFVLLFLIVRWVWRRRAPRRVAAA